MSDRARITAKTPEAKRANSLSQTKKTDFSQSINSPNDHILHLQRTIGNQAVQRLFKSGAIQAKLKIGQPKSVSLLGKKLPAHELTHVVQQSSTGPYIIQRRVGGDITRMSITEEFAHDLTDEELEEQVRIVRNQLSIPWLSSAEYEAQHSNLRILEDEAFRRMPSVEVVSANVPTDQISIRLRPHGTTGDLTLQLTGPGGTSHAIRTAARPAGTYSETFDITHLPVGEYNNVRAIWRVSGANYSDNFPYHIRVLGVYRHSQYNIPDESTCTGDPVNAYITNNACNFTPTTLRQQFVNQVNLNGSGVSIAHGNLQREAFCIGRAGAPADAANRSFRQVGAFHGSCNSNTGALNNSTVARPPAHPHLGCDDRVYIHTAGIKTVTDRCPGCALNQLDNFTTDTACAGIRDLGNFMTIKLLYT